MYGNYRRRYRKKSQPKKTYKTYPKYNMSIVKKPEIHYYDHDSATSDGTQSFTALLIPNTDTYNRKSLVKYVNMIMQINSSATTSIFFRVSLLWITRPQYDSTDDDYVDKITDYYDTTTLTYAEGAPRKITTMSRAITLMDKTIKLADNDDGGEDVRYIKRFIKLNKYTIVNYNSIGQTDNIVVEKGLLVLVYGTTATTPANVGVKYNIRSAYIRI